MTPTIVQYELAEGLATISLNQPERRNVLSFDLARELNDALDVAAADPLAKVVVLKANGPAFCAGMDLKSIALDNPAQALEFATLLAGTYRRLLTLPAPLLCAVDGPAMGGAVGLALAGDLLWVGPGAKIAFPETRLGVVPALVSVVARRRIAPGKLMGLALTGVEMSAEDALRIGLADFIAPEGAADAARAFGQKILVENSSEAMHRTKAFLQAQFGAELEKHLADAIAEFKVAVSTKACAAGLAAFREKRKIVWSEAEA